MQEMLEKKLEQSQEDKQTAITKKNAKAQLADLKEEFDALQIKHSQLQEEVLGPDIRDMCLHRVGKINGHKCEIRGFCSRSGMGHPRNPDGPCMNCLKMLDLKTTDRMLLAGINCPYVGMRGHIVELPKQVTSITKSTEYMQEMKDYIMTRYKKRGK